MKIKPLACLKFILIIFLLNACGSIITVQPTATNQQAIVTSIPDLKTSNSYPLAESGPFLVGLRTFSLIDSNRGDRKVGISVWYPAVASTGGDFLKPVHDAEPDRSGEPYPLILSSTKVARILAPYLVSRGFTWASVNEIDSYWRMCDLMIDQPLDILFVLDQVATNPPVGFEGLIDADNAGAIGYSFDGYNTLAMSGARINPDYYLSQCPDPDPTTQTILGILSAFSCTPADDWQKFVDHAGKSITESEDGFWQPLTDDRIQAVMPLACEGWWLFGESGLAFVDRPVLMIDSTEDELYKENVLIFKYMGTKEKSIISFIGQDHMMIYDPEMIARMAHFAASFFGYHLQGRQDLAQYFSEDFVSEHEDLYWGEFPNF